MKSFRKIMLLVVGVALLGIVVTAPVAANNGKGPPGFGHLYLNDNIVRTVVPPSAMPNEGTDPFFAVTDGAVGQLGIAGVGPGTGGYHGGHWAVYEVSWNVAPYLLTSDEAVMAAEAAGDVTVERNTAADFLCPIQP